MSNSTLRALTYATSIYFSISASPLWAASTQVDPAQVDSGEQMQSADDEWDMEGWGEEEQVKPYRFSAFLEAAMGTRLFDDNVIATDKTLADLRTQVQFDYDFDASRFKFTADLYYDGVLDQTKLQVREAAWQGNLSSLGDWGQKFDLKVGQQVMTWGTGDYVFLNDLFPKDFQSFFSGREDEYLKAPSLSAKLSGFFDWANVDLVITPEFTADNYINGDYFSFYAPMLGENVAPGFSVSPPLRPESPEYAVRIYKSIDATELALYGYDGFSKSPSSATNQGEPTFSELQVYGASVLTTLGSGLFNAEVAYYDSNNENTDNILVVPNDQSRWLLGYEQELIKNLTGSVQWYLERNEDIQESSQMQRSRIWLTQRLRYQAMQQTLIINLFNFYSTTDQDGYLKLSADYSPVDNWRLSTGLNLFYGDQASTFFGQFEDASNLFFRYRYFY